MEERNDSRVAVLSDEELIEATEERIAIMQTLSHLLYAPLSQEDFDGMDEQVFLALAEDAEEPLFAEGCNDIYRFLRRRNTATCQELRSDFTQTFHGVREYEGAAAVPYESTYVCREGEHIGDARLRVFRTYKEHCVKLNEGVDVPDDHLAFELQFMAFMARRCMQGVEARDYAAALEAANAQREFLEEHILPWVGQFFDLAAKLIETRFYEGVLKMARAFIEGDAATLEAQCEYLEEKAEIPVQTVSNPE